MTTTTKDQYGRTISTSTHEPNLPWKAEFVAEKPGFCETYVITDSKDKPLGQFWLTSATEIDWLINLVNAAKAEVQP